ncbi:MAG: caspase family protein, partial [Bacteroidales bacterium]|nr:caspase family protein [Bacteroidales bacterium]
IIFSQENPNLETVIQKGHLKYVSCADFSPDGKYVATGSLDNSIKLWNLSTGKEIRSFNKHTGTVLSLFFSKDGKTILSASSDNTAIIFDLLTGKALHIFKLEKENLETAVFSPDYTKVILGDNRDNVEVWDIQTEEKLGNFIKSYDYKVHPLLVSPDGTKILNRLSYKEVNVVELSSGNTVLTINSDKPYSASFSPDGKYIAIGSIKLFTQVFDAETGKEICYLKDNEETKCDGCRQMMAFSSDSKTIITGALRGNISAWQVPGGKKIRTYHDCENQITQLNFSANNNFIIATESSRLFVYNVKTGNKVLEKKDSYINHFTVSNSPDGIFAILPGENNKADIWNISTGRKTKSLEGYLNKESDSGMEFSYSNWTHTSILKYLTMKSAVAVSPDGKYMIKGNLDSIAMMIDLETGRLVQEFKGHSKIVYSFDFSKNGKMLLTAGGDKVIKLWDTQTGKEIRSFKGHRELVFDAKFSNDDKYIVSGSWDASIRVWETATGKEKKYINLNNNSPYVLGFTPGDLYIMAGSLDYKSGLWEVDAGEKFRDIIGHTHLLSDFDFSPDGKTMVTASWDGTAKVWNLLSGMLINKFSAHNGSVYAVAFDPQGRFIATGSNDRTIQLWNPDTGEVLKVLEGNSNSITDIKITNDGKRLISCTVDGIVKIWDLDSYKELYTYIRISRKDWLVQNSAGFFDGSPEALKLVNYVSGMDVIPVGSLFEKFFSPGLLERIMKGEKFGETGNLNKMIKNPVGLKLAIRGEKNNESITFQDSVLKWREPMLPLEVSLETKESKAEEIRVFNNGKLVFNENLNDELVFRGGNKQTRTFDIGLSNGENKISAMVLNADRTESEPISLTVMYDDVAAKTDLYILALGVNNYKNPAYKLNFAVNDAKTYSGIVKKGADTIFNKVELILLKDEAADKKGILAAIKKISAEIGPEDVFLFYYAGHGVMSNEAKENQSEFYIVPFDVTNIYGDVNMLKEKAVSATELMGFSQNIKALKQLFVLDACQSGGALNVFAQRGASREKAIAQLARSTGTFFLTASQDIQFANEAGNLNHGLFTYAIIEGLKGEADGGNKDNKITVNELKSYVEDRVPELSEQYHGSPQYPTGYSYGQDFPVVIIK